MNTATAPTPSTATRLPVHHWEFGALGITNPDAPSSLSPYFDFIRNNHDAIPGDIAEFGVFRGASLLATAILLKQLGSSKHVYGYDTFEGFPNPAPQDDPAFFLYLHDQGLITDEHLRDVNTNLAHRRAATNTTPTATSISTSAAFDDTNEHRIRRLAEHLGLDNITLVKGDFADTLTNPKTPRPAAGLCAALLDCDLFHAYRHALPFAYKLANTDAMLYLDEYHSLKFPGPRLATHQFFKNRLESPTQLPSNDPAFPRYAVHKA